MRGCGLWVGGVGLGEGVEHMVGRDDACPEHGFIVPDGSVGKDQDGRVEVSLNVEEHEFERLRVGGVVPVVRYWSERRSR